jgi:hypothetical protein
MIFYLVNPWAAFPGQEAGRSKQEADNPVAKAFSEGFLFQEIITYRTVVQFSWNK